MMVTNPRNELSSNRHYGTLMATDVKESEIRTIYPSRRGRMNTHIPEQPGWAIARMQEHVSYTGWLFAMTSGLALWTLMIRMVV